MLEQQKPCGARFVDAKPDLVAKAARLMGLKVYKPSSPEVAELAKKLPVGQPYATGHAFVPHVRQSLYSDVRLSVRDHHACSVYNRSRVQNGVGPSGFISSLT